MLGFLKSREWNLVLSFERRSLGGFFSFKKLGHTVLASPMARLRSELVFERKKIPQRTSFNTFIF
jgi:hypothetical protein